MSLTDAERAEIERLFGYVPEPEPLEQMLAAVERIAQARYAEGQRDALAEAAEDHAAVDAHDRAVVAHLAEQWGDLRGRLAPHIALQDVKGAMTIVNRGDGR